jgi:hypothetical protein
MHYSYRASVIFYSVPPSGSNLLCSYVPTPPGFGKEASEMQNVLMRRIYVAAPRSLLVWSSNTFSFCHIFSALVVLQCLSVNFDTYKPIVKEEKYISSLIQIVMVVFKISSN